MLSADTMAETTALAVPPGLAPEIQEVCTSVLELLLPHRRAADPDDEAPASAFPEQLRQIADFVETGDPIVFTLPGFPCKSPNPAKVLGHLPDEGERLSLAFLDRLCQAVEAVYPPGARMLICSDGHVFADLIRVPDEQVDAYGDELRAMMDREGLTRLGTFNLNDVLGERSYDDKRTLLLDRYAPAMEQLHAEVRNEEDTKRLYCGITRFLVEDTAGFDGSRSALQRECRQRAYGVIQRSRAWGALIADHHTRSVRLSIHPQSLGAAKFGIRLLDSADAWTTPWHSCVLHRSDGSWELIRRDEAEQHGAVAVRHGRPSHFEAEALD